MANIFVALLLILIVIWAILHIVKDKKNGRECANCPYSGSCTSGKCPSDKKKSSPQ